jgi:hypothetical protein
MNELPACPPARLTDLVVIGGGCYGTFYSRQLAEAKARGRVDYERVLVVDRRPQCQMARELGEAEDRRLVVSDWGPFLDQYLSAGPPDRLSASHIVPSPLMPHLMYQWLLRRARARWPGRLVETRPLPGAVGTPYETTGAEGTRFVSFADWICPTHCVEPALCPEIRAPRTWEMREALEDFAAQRGLAESVLFVCRHLAFGVGTLAVADVLEADAAVIRAGTAGSPADVLVGTVSSCHGAVNLVHLGRDGPAMEPAGVLYSRAVRSEE